MSNTAKLDCTLLPAAHTYNNRKRPEPEEMTSLLSHKIIDDAIKRYGKLNIHALSGVCGSTYTGLWYTIKGKRKWNAELWLTVLCALDVVEVEKDKIIIHTKMTSKIKGMARKLAAYDYNHEAKK